MDQVEKYFTDHANPSPKSEPFGLKLFNTKLNEEEERRKDRCLESIKSVLKHSRVDRRVARAVAHWLPNENKAKVTKLTGLLTNFGVHNKNGRFLNIEEALYLLEINKLELLLKNIPFSIQEGFKFVKNFNKYVTFKKLALQGYKMKDVYVEKVNINKRKLDRVAEDEPATKLKKRNSTESIFENLRVNGPKNFDRVAGNEESPDYYVKGPGENFDFRLTVESNKDYICTADPIKFNVVALCSDSDVSFYKFFNANIPNL